MSLPSDEAEEVELLPTWDSLEDLQLGAIQGDRINREWYEEFGAMHGPYGYVRVCADVRLGTRHRPSESKHYALEAQFDGHVEFKHACGDKLAAKAFAEMQSYLEN